MADEKKHGGASFIEKIDRWVTALTAIPVLGIIVKKVFEKISEKGVEKIGKRVEKILGFDLEGAKRDVSDEIIYGVAVNALNNEVKEMQVDAFEERLRREDAKKAEAFILFVAKIVMRFEREIRETVNPPKGSTDPKIEQSYKSLAEGIEYAKKFLESLLKNVGSDEDETFSKRVAFLQGKNVFSLISPDKKESEFVKKAKEVFSGAFREFSDGVKRESSSFSDDCGKFKDWAEKFYESSKGGKK